MVVSPSPPLPLPACDKNEIPSYIIVCVWMCVWVCGDHIRAINLPLVADAVLGKDVHSGRDGIPSAVRNLFAVAHSVAHTSLLMSTHSSEVGW